MDQAAGSLDWQRSIEGGTLRIGERLRTGPEGLARLDLSWMTLTVSPGSIVRFPDEFLLSAVLESGRVVVHADDRQTLKLVTAQAEVRGQGGAVVRQQGETTLVTCLAGLFVVRAGEHAVTLLAGRGTLVTARSGPSAAVPAPAPPPTSSLRPGLDCLYASPSEPVELTWRGEAPAYQVEVLPVGSDHVLLQRDLTGPPARLAIPWNGAFRWRVSSRDARGLEGLPSGEGLICVDAR